MGCPLEQLGRIPSGCGGQQDRHQGPFRGQENIGMGMGWLRASCREQGAGSQPRPRLTSFPYSQGHSFSLAMPCSGQRQKVRQGGGTF